jgi:hypothetical protein
MVGKTGMYLQDTQSTYLVCHCEGMDQIKKLVVFNIKFGRAYNMRSFLAANHVEYLLVNETGVQGSHDKIC